MAGIMFFGGADAEAWPTDTTSRNVALRRKAQHLLLPRPLGGRVGESGHADAAGQPTLHRGLDQRRRKRASEIVMMT